MAKDWKEAMKKKRKYAKLFSKNRSVENFELKKKWRNIATSCRRKAIREYWSKISVDLGRNPWKYYNTFKPFLGKEKTVNSNKHINIKTEVNHLETEQKKVAEVMANYFTTMADGIGVWNEESNECKFDAHESVVAIEKVMDGNSNCFQFRKINQIEVKELLDKLNVSKANGPSLFSPKLLKLASPGIAPSMTKLFNTSVYLRSWPKAWKSGEWVSVYKKGEKNYRPVTVLDSVGKVFEQLICKQIGQHYDTII